MGSKEILDAALKLKAPERFAVIEGLIESLDRPDPELSELWAEEAENRLKAYREGRLKAVDMDDVFRD